MSEPRRRPGGAIQGNLDLFAGRAEIRLGPGALVLPEFARCAGADLLAALDRIVQLAPFRHMHTPGGQRMSVAFTNCGSLGWVSDAGGYRYQASDPLRGRPWPPMPAAFLDLARRAAARAGFTGFDPDACLMGLYHPGARLSLHQDRDERGLDAPIVSVSLGAAAVFVFGGNKRTDKTVRVPLAHGDVVVWGGPDRLRYHGVTPLALGDPDLLGGKRINLSFRQAG